MKTESNRSFLGFFARGVTTTHPLCSVFIFILLFVFMTSVVNSRASSGSNLPIMSDWQFAQALDAYSGLTVDQKDIANFLVGANAYAAGGLSNYNLATNFSSYSDTIETTKSFGSKIWDSLMTFDQQATNVLIGRKNNLSNFLGSAVSYAKNIASSFSDWLSNVGIDYQSNTEFRIHLGKDLSTDYVDFYGDEGLYNWQSTSTVITPNDFTFTWSEAVPSSGSEQQKYYNYVNSDLYVPYVHANRTENTTTYYSSLVSSTFFSTYKYIFVNLSNNSVYFCDDNGNMPSNVNYSVNWVYFFTWNTPQNAFANHLNNSIIEPKVLNFLNYGNLKALFTALNSNPNLLYLSNAYLYFNFADWIEGLYIGYSWSDKAPWTSDFDLNLSSVSQYVTIYNPVNTIYLDITGFMRDLYDNPTIIYNYVINNSIDDNGDPAGSDDLKNDPNSPTIPLSGINIGSEFFKLPDGSSPLFNGYIPALWRNTKDMVTYLASILGCMTFADGGLAYVVYGAISIGILGGVVSKFLL